MNRYPLVGAVLLLTLAAASCATQDGPTTVSHPATSASRSAAPPTKEAVTLAAAITAAGAKCTNGPKQTCTLDSVSFELSVDGWRAERAQREKACSQGYVNSSYQIVTDGRGVITTDHNSDYAAILSALKKHGADARQANYCP